MLRLESRPEEEGDLRTVHESRRERQRKRKIDVALGGASDNGSKSKGKLRVEDGRGEMEQERVEGAYKRAEEAQVRAERKAKKDGYMQWGKMQRGRGRERDAVRGKRGVLTSTILEEENSSDTEF